MVTFEGRDLVRDLDQKLAALFGTTYDQIVINDMVVRPTLQQIFISVERGRSTDALPTIVNVNHGQLEVLELDRIPHSQVGIPNEPGPKAMLEFDTQRSFAITDVKYCNGEIFVTGVSNQRFASTLHRIPYPFKPQMTRCTVDYEDKRLGGEQHYDHEKYAMWVFRRVTRCSTCGKSS